MDSEDSENKIKIQSEVLFYFTFRGGLLRLRKSSELKIGGD